MLKHKATKEETKKKEKVEKDNNQERRFVKQIGKYGKSVIRGREINNNGNHNLMLFQINSFLSKPLIWLMFLRYNQLYPIKGAISPLVHCRINSCCQSWWLPLTSLWSLHVSGYPLYTQIIRFTCPSLWIMITPLQTTNPSFFVVIIVFPLFQFYFYHDWRISFPS